MRSAWAIAVAAVTVLFAFSVTSGATPVRAVAATATIQTTAAAAATPSVAATPSAESTRTYDLDFTLPTAGKSGCLVCHGDPNLAKVGAETTSSIYVDVEVLQYSAHAEDTPCTGCHLDFAYTSPHTQTLTGEEWRVTAGSECKNCHTEAATAYANGAHSPANEPGKTATETVEARRVAGKPLRVPICGDCHGGHAIPAADDEAGQAALHLSGIEMCGQCHERESASYTDYYHGAAYANGSSDAPSCWDCHGYHDILPSSDRRSPVHASQLQLTCGQDGCHEGADQQFLDYTQLVHGQDEIVEENVVVGLVGRFKSAVSGVFSAIGSWF